MSVLEQVLDIRLREVLRQDLGGVYSVSANGVVERSPHPSRLFSISFGCSPDQVDALIAATRAELDNIMKNGVKDDVLDKIRQAVVRDREVSLRTNGTWLAWLERTARYGDDPTTILDPSGYLARVTNEHLKAAAQRSSTRSRSSPRSACPSSLCATQGVPPSFVIISRTTPASGASGKSSTYFL